MVNIHSSPVNSRLKVYDLYIHVLMYSCIEKKYRHTLLLCDSSNTSYKQACLSIETKEVYNMAINDIRAQANQAALAAAKTVPQGQQTAQPQQAAQAATDNTGRWSFHSPFGRAPISKNIGGELLGRLRTAVDLTFKEVHASYEVTTIPIDNANKKPHFACLIVCVKDKLSTHGAIAYHTLLIEGSAELLSSFQEQIRDKSVKVTRVSGDAFDADLMKIVADRVTAEHPNTKIFNALATVVPKEFNVEDKVAIKNLCVNTALACATEIELRTTNIDLDLANYSGDSKLVATLGFSNQQIENAVGQPVRADVMVSFTSQQTRNLTPQSINTGDRVESVSKLTGFIDLIYSPSAPQTPMYGNYIPPQQYGAPTVPLTQTYGARLVITSMESSQVNTPAGQLLSLVTAMAAADKGNWMQTFRTSNQENGRSDKKQNMRDIGAIGIEVTADPVNKTPGKRFVTNTDSFRPQDLGQMIGMYFHPGLVLSLDVPECGPETWQHVIFSAAASGNPAASQALIDAANSLTHNNFTNHFPSGGQIFTDLGQRVHTGYYEDANGVKRDLRDCDYLYVANMLGDRNPEEMAGWSDTFTRTDYPLRERLAERERVISGIFTNVVYTGFAHRVTFRKTFTDALAFGCADVGLMMDIVAPTNTGDMNNQRGVGSFVSEALIGMNNNGQGVFNRGNGRVVAANQYNTFGSRYN